MIASEHSRSGHKPVAAFSRGFHGVLFAMAVLLSACLPATQTLIELDADDTLRRDGQTLLVRITGVDGVVLERRLAIDEDWRWPTSIPVSPMAEDPERRFLLEAVLSTGEQQVSTRASLGFADRRQFRVRFEFTEACLGVECAPGLSCVAGDCVSAFVNPEPERCGLRDGEVCDPERQCGCPEGHSCRRSPHGATCRRPACETSAECDARFAGFVCDYESGVCVPPSDGVCRMPPPEREGPQLAGEACDAAQFCTAGLVCVANSRSFDADAPGHPLNSTDSGGTCRRPCDPCVGCGEETCIALPSGGGFCAGLGLSGPGGLCGVFTDWRQECAGEALCVDGRCVAACTPDLTLGRSGETGSASTSAACESDERCVRGGGSFGTTWSCGEPRLADIGEYCDSAIGLLCDYPGLCVGDRGSAGICNLSRDGCGDCPEETHCRTFGWGEACVREGGLPRGVACADDLDCQATFECLDQGDERRCG